MLVHVDPKLNFPTSAWIHQNQSPDMGKKTRLGEGEKKQDAKQCYFKVWVTKKHNRNHDIFCEIRVKHLITVWVMYHYTQEIWPQLLWNTWDIRWFINLWRLVEIMPVGWTNTSPQKIGQNPKGSSSNHPFFKVYVMLVSGKNLLINIH